MRSPGVAWAALSASMEHIPGSGRCTGKSLRNLLDGNLMKPIVRVDSGSRGSEYFLRIVVVERRVPKVR